MKGWHMDSQAKSQSLLNTAFDLGVTLFDTSDRFGNGFSEELIGSLLSHVRHEIVISTKGGFDFYPTKFGRAKEIKNLSYDYLIFACEQSLKRLKTDYIDIYMIDHPGLSDVESDESFEALNRLKEDGKILAWGTSVDYSEDMDEVIEILIKDRGTQVLNIPHNFMETEFVDKFSHLIDEYSTGILAKRTHCFGLFDGSLIFKEIQELGVHEWEIINPGLIIVMTKNRELLDVIHQQRDLKSDSLEYSLRNRHVASVLPNITNLSSSW